MDNWGRARRLLSAVALIGLTTALGPATADAQRADRGQVGRLIGNKVHSPVVATNPLVLRIPVVLRRGVRGNRVTVELLDVSAPGGRQRVIFDKFGVAFQKPRRARGPALLVSVATSPALTPGTYKLRVALRQRRRSQRLAFQIDIAPAELRQPGTIRIRRTERWPFHDGVERHHLPLRETGRRTQITNVSVTQIDPLRSGTEQAPGSIAVRASEKPIAVVPGGFTEVEIEPRGSFPVGTSTGKAEIDAGELAKPTELEVEVTQVRSRGYLVAILLLSVGLGWLTRTELVRRIQRAQAFAQIQQMLSRLRRARARYSDRTFTERMLEIEDDLLAARDTEDAAEIEAAITQADTDRQAALKDLKQRADAASKEHKELASTIAARREALPTDLAAALEGAQGALASARVMLDAGDVNGASDLIARTRSDVTAATSESGRSWRDAAASFVEAYERPNSSAIASADQAVLTKAEEATRALAAYSPDSTLGDQLAALVAAIDAVDSFAQAVAASAGLIVTQVGEILTPAEGTLLDERATTLIAIKQGLEGLRTALAEALSHNPGAYDDARSADAALAAQVASAIQMTAQLYETTQAVAPTLAAGDFIGSARAAVSQEDTGAFGSRLLSLAGPSAAVRTTVLERAVPLTAHPEAASLEAALPDQSSMVVDPVASVAAVHQKDRGELYKATLLQTALLAVVVVIVGYLAFVDQWTGTTANFVAAFAAGYLADLSVDAVRRNVEGLRGTPAEPANPPEGDTPAGQAGDAGTPATPPQGGARPGGGTT